MALDWVPMRSRTAFFFLSLSGVIAISDIGCSSDDEGEAPPDGGPAPDAGPPTDGGGDARDAASIDCASDVGPDGLAKHLACTGLYADFATKKVADDHRPYTPGLVFWSDGADKQRFVFLPPGTTIDISTFDDWKLPVGTTLFKEFTVDGKKIETRLYAKTAAGWVHTTYRWNEAEDDAVRKDSGETVPRAGTPYEVPTAAQCEYCHNAGTEPLLGFDAVSLGVASAKGVTLATLAAEGKLSAKPPATALVVPDDPTGKAAAAVGWLHGNCGGCHVAHAGAGAAGSPLKLRLHATELVPDGGAPSTKSLSAYQTGYCKPSEREDPNTGAFYAFIAGAAPTSSIASILAHARAAPGQESIVTQMPPLVTHMPDTAGVALLDAWIAALPACPK